MSKLNVDKIRRDFPILQREINGRPLVYLDSGATSQKPRQVIDAIKDYYENHNSNVHRGIYTLSEEATELYEGAREKVRSFINADSVEEIIFTGGTTESINLVVYSWAKQNLEEGDIVLISEMEHHSNFVPWHALRREIGVEIEFIPVLDNGLLDIQAYKHLLENDRVKLLAITHVSNVLGTINPIKEIVKLARDAGIITLVDGAQAAAHIPVDVQALDCDFYAFSSHKMLGPTGMGVLYARSELLENMRPFLYGGDMISVVKKDKVFYNDLPWKFEAGTPHICGAIGFAAAIDYLSQIGMDKIHEHEEALIKYAYIRFNEEFDNEKVILYGPSPLEMPESRSGVLSFSINGVHPHDVSSILNEDNICVRSGHHCAQPLIDSLGVEALSRATFYLYNNEEDIEAMIKGVKRVQEIFK